MLVAFTLSMPSVNTWDGRWSGEGCLYTRVLPFTSKTDLARIESLLGQTFRYSFGDGWCAAIDVRQIDSREARSLQQRSEGFCGYDWMVDSLLAHGHIQTEA